MGLTDQYPDQNSRVAWDDIRAFLVRQGPVIAAVILLVVLGTYGVIEVFMTEMYEAKASILVKLGRENVDLPATVQKGGLLTTGVRKEDLNSEIQTVRSRVLIEKVLDEIGLAAFTDQPPVPQSLFQAIKAQLKRAKDWVKAQIDWLMILANLKKKLTPREQVILGIEGGLAITVEKDSDVVTVALRMPDPDLAVGILDRLLTHYRDYRVQVRQNANVKPFFDARVNELTQRLNEIEEAKREKGNRTSIAEQRTLLLRRRHELVDLLLKQRDDLNRQVDTTESEIIALQRQRVVLNDREAALAEQVEASRVVAPNPSVLPIKERLAAARVERSKLLTRFRPDADVIKNIEQEIGTLEGLLAKEDATQTASVTMQSSTVKNWVKQNLEQVEVQLGGLQAKRAALRAQVTRVDSEIAVIGRASGASGGAVTPSPARISIATDGAAARVAGADARQAPVDLRAQALRNEIGQIDNDIRALDSGDRALEVIERERKIAEETYTSYVKRREEAGVAEQLDRSRISNISMLTPPTKPFEPVAPRKLRLLGIGLASGLALGCALGLARQYLSDIVRGPSDVEQEPGVPYLGTVRVGSR